jgi:uncharacterized GH25 family protein
VLQAESSQDELHATRIRAESVDSLKTEGQTKEAQTTSHQSVIIDQTSKINEASEIDSEEIFSQFSELQREDSLPGSGGDTASHSMINKVKWQDFDEQSYIGKTRLRPDEDAYKRHKFNQTASDELTSNREIYDTRHPE